MSLKDDKVVEFKCPHLEECLRQILEIGERAATVEDIEKLNVSLIRKPGYEPCVDLDLRNYKITDISPLSVLTNLRALGIDSCHIKDFSPLNDLASFEKLWICPNTSKRAEDKMTDISALSVLHELKHLHFTSSHYVKDISPLRELKNLTDLKLSVSNANDLSPLSALSDLKTLWIPYFGSHDISVLFNLKKLKELKLFHCDIKKGDRRRISEALPKCKIHIHKKEN